MEWIASLITAIDYIEEHLLEFTTAKDMAERVSRGNRLIPISDPITRK